jgi:hypothetical protein
LFQFILDQGIATSVRAEPTTSEVHALIVLWPTDRAMFVENVAVHSHFARMRTRRVVTMPLTLV